MSQNQRKNESLVEASILIGERLKEARLQKGLTLTKVAEKMGSHRPIINRDETGLHILDLSRIFKYAEVLEVDVRWLLEPLDDFQLGIWFEGFVLKAMIDKP